MRPRRLACLAIAVALVLAVALVYVRTGRNGFVKYDDNSYVYENPVVLRGLTPEGIAWAFGIHASNWHPLTWISHMADASLFGARAGGHHLHSALLHGANALLLAAALARLTGALWPSALVAALFAVHPLRVESVAWASERKDVLCGLFFLLAVAAYARHARRPSWVRFAVVAALFALALASKPMAITLPLVLLLLDWWPLGRFAARRRPADLLLEKVPLLVLAAGSALITLRAQLEGVRDFVAPSLAARLANATVSCAAYLGQSLWPSDLAVLYPYPTQVGWAGPVAAAALLAALLGMAVAARRRHPVLLFGVLWYLVMLVPVLGIVQVGAQARANRYTYLPLIGPALAAVWLAVGLAPAGRRVRAAGVAVAAAALTAFGAAAWLQAGFWRNSRTLFERTTAVTADNYLILTNLGQEYVEAGEFDAARRALEQAVRANPGHCNALYTLGGSYYNQGRFAEAIGPYERSLQCYKAQSASRAYVADVHYFLGSARQGLGRYAEAEREFLSVLSLRPDDARAASQLAFVRAVRRLPDP
ncbi:MAG TPA: tetratricopeptide repeat protein [bacterium]